MFNIQPLYVQYDAIIQEFGEAKIEKRFRTLLTALKDFISGMECSECVNINETVLMYSLLDYFSDIARLKSFHHIDQVNEIKIIAYETFWLLKRKPLQICSNEKEYAFINEQFALSHIINFLSRKNEQGIEILDTKDLDFFINTLFYFLKYRPYDAQTIELLLISFEAGGIYHHKLQKVKSPSHKSN